MRYLRLHTLGFAALLVTLTVIHCIPTEAQADRRRRWTTYGSDRGRLVVACDMRSDTCSDGRKITTQRATPVPCEVAPGVWEIIPADRGCYSVRGLESWAQNTSYLSWGAELDRSPWTSRRGGTVEKLPDGWRVKNDPNQNQSGWDQLLPGAASGEVWTSAYILRTSNDVFFRLWAGSSQTCGAPFVLNTGGAWRQFSCSTVVPSNPLAAIYPGDNVGSIPRPQYSVDVKAAWIVKSATPGRPCWGGEAPVTCAADQHTISTEGWPTTDGEICITADIGNVADSMLLDSRYGGGNTWVRFLSGRLMVVDAVGPKVVPGTHRVCMRMEGGLVSATLNGEPAVLEYAHAVDWGTATYLGRSSAGTRIDGSIRALTVRSYEEVSP